VVVEADLTNATVAAPVVEQPIVDPVEEPAEDGLQVEEMTFDETNENPFIDMFAAALAEDHHVVVTEPTAIAAAVEEEVKSKKTKKPKAAVAPPARTHALIKIGEYDQEIEMAVFVPWFDALVAETGGDGHRLKTELKKRLQISA